MVDVMQVNGRVERMDVMKSTESSAVRRQCVLLIGVAAAACCFMSVTASSQDEDAELAKKLANPVASLISVPLQYNYDENIGPEGDGGIHRLNIQPVAPFSLTEDWNLITRTIVPLIDQQDIPAGGQGESGLGDVLASQFFSPKKPTASGWIWGAGPVELLPTASKDELGGEKWGLGPTAVLLKQMGPWTVGLLANHVWSVGGEDDRADVNATFLQPFASYITATKTTLGLNTESTYDWEAEEWAVPVNLTVSQLLKVGPQIIQVGVGARYWADSAPNGPEDWGARATLTFLFPK
jgi:hypothetical protein